MQVAHSIVQPHNVTGMQGLLMIIVILVGIEAVEVSDNLVSDDNQFMPLL